MIPKKKARPELDRLIMYIPHPLVIQLNEIAEVSNESFDDVLVKTIKSGADVWGINFILKNERLKLDRLNSLISQVYTLMNLDFVTIDPVISMKFVQIHSLSSPVLYKNNGLFSERQKDLIAMQIHEIYRYGHDNFLEEFNKFKAWVFGNSRTHYTKALFKFNVPSIPDDISITSTNNGKKNGKKAKKVKQTYRDLDDKFQTCESVLPPLGMTEKEFEAKT